MSVNQMATFQREDLMRSHSFINMRKTGRKLDDARLMKEYIWIPHLNVDTADDKKEEFKIKGKKDTLHKHKEKAKSSVCKKKLGEFTVITNYLMLLYSHDEKNRHQARIKNRSYLIN